MTTNPSPALLRVAMVGCGWVAGTQITEGFALLSDRFAVTLACDLNLERARHFASEHAIPRSEADYAAVLCDPDIDVVSICTPPSLHFTMVADALRAGKHVVCEKPFTSSLRLTDKIAEIERGARGRVMPILQYRFQPGFQRIRRILASGLAGKPYTASVETAWRRGADYYAVPWRGRFDTELGGVLVTQSIHIHDLFLALFGEVASVKAFKTTRVNPIEVEDCAVAALRMKSGALASLTATLGSQEPVTRIRLCFQKLTVERQCRGDDAKWPGREPWTVTPADETTAAALAKLDLSEPDAPTGFAAQFAAFGEALTRRTPFPVTLADARRSLELVTALYHAAETDETVQLPVAADHARYGGWISNSSRTHPASA